MSAACSHFNAFHHVQKQHNTLKNISDQGVGVNNSNCNSIKSVAVSIIFGSPENCSHNRSYSHFKGLLDQETKQG